MSSCFLDTNVIIYLMDESSLNHQKAKKIISEFEKNNTHIYLTHLILAEFIHVFSSLLRIAKEKNIHKNVELALKKIWLLPEISIISPPEDFVFTDKVIKIMKKHQLKSNDAYVLATLIHHHIPNFATFDRNLEKAAKKLAINIV